MSHKIEITIENEDVWKALSRVSSVLQISISTLMHQYLNGEIEEDIKLLVRAIYNALHDKINLDYPEIQSVLE